MGGQLWGAAWLDPLIGIVGAGLVAAWAYSLLRKTGKILLDAEMDNPLVEEIKDVLAHSGFRLTLIDLHLGRIGKGKYHCILALSSPDATLMPERVRQLLRAHNALVHITVEINHPTPTVVLFRQNDLV